MSANADEVSEFQTDIAVIGAGASGLALAANLDRDVIVIDGGTFEANPDRDRNFTFETTGLAMNTQSLRRRLVGGAAAMWSGRCAELDPVDFETRPWIKYSGWPIEYSCLRPFYDKAWKNLQLPNADDMLARESEREEQLQLPQELALQLWQYAYAKPNTARHLGAHFIKAMEASSRRLLIAADAVELVANGTKVIAVRLADRSGQIITIRANQFVLACGCVEASRFLLDNADNCRSLIGPVQKWLGRGFHQHLLIDAGQIISDRRDGEQLQRLLNRFRSPPAQSHEFGLRLSRDAVMRNQLVSASATFRYSANKKFNPLEKLRLGIARLKGSEPVFSNPATGIEFSIEQDIDFDNAISLSEARDPGGRRKASVHWNIKDLELRSGAALHRSLGEWLSKQQLGRVDELAGPEDIANLPMRDSLHHMGGTRMSETKATGVVDKNLMLHGAQNLSIVGGSVFPTGGQVNPTLTMMALSIRLADHLNSQT